MNRIFACLGVLALLFLLSAGETAAVGRVSGEVCRHLDAAETLVRAEDWARAAEQENQAEALWQDAAWFLYIVLHHNAADEIDLLFRRTAVYLNCREKDECLAALRELRRRLELLYGMEKLSWENIL